MRLLRLAPVLVCCLVSCDEADLGDWAAELREDDEWLWASDDARAIEARRLLFGFSFPEASISNLVHGAAKFVEDTATAVAKKVPGVREVMEIFKKAKQWVEQGISVAKKGWGSMRAFASRLKEMFQEFSPLKPIFEKESGMLELLTSRDHMKRLVGVVRKLLDTSTVLKALGEAIHSIGDMFTQLYTFFASLLEKLPVRRLAAEDGRRLFTFTDLLKGLDFQVIAKYMRQFVEQSTGFAMKLQEIQEVLDPLLAKLDAQLGRRLGLADLDKDQKMYAEAVRGIVPTWKSMEGMGISMCPQVLASLSSANSLSCRIAGFVEKAGLSGAVGMLVQECGEYPERDSQGEANGKGCPATSSSEDIEDALGNNAEVIGWVLAILGAFGCLGATGAGAVGVAALTGRKEDESRDTNYDSEAVPLSRSYGGPNF